MSTTKAIDVLTMEPGHLIRRTSKQIPAAPKWLRQNMIEYCRHYAVLYYADQGIPASVLERINALEERWVSKK